MPNTRTPSATAALGRLVGRDEQVFNTLAASTGGNRESAAHRPDRSVQGQFPDKEMALGRPYHAHRAENPQGHRQIEASVFFSYICRCQVGGQFISALLMRSRLSCTAISGMPWQ